MSGAATLDAALKAAGLPSRSVVLAEKPGPDAPRPPEGPWVIVPYGAQFFVGGVGRGRFPPYEALWTFEDAVDIAVRLAATPAESGQSDRADTHGLAASESVGNELTERGRATAGGIRSRTARRGGQAGPHGLAPGDVLDCVGPETGHHLYALGTPFPQRSQPRATSMPRTRATR